MYELSRIRVCSAGPAGARFQDVILDFSGAGQPVAAVQENLFERAAQVVRPSPASVVFLENGGGKSVLMKLLFSVVLPGRRQVKDAPDPRLLEDFVLARDVSHIALEWMHATTGRLLVTAKTLCWKDQVVSTVAENLIEHWYAFHPSPTLGLDSLPIVEEGKYRSLSSYRECVKELGAQDQRLQVSWPKSQEEWTDLLDHLGLDPELFRYQRAMNKDEGEAVHAFTLDSDGGFVDFLLKAVYDHKSLNDLASLVSTYAHKLAGRKDLLLELSFVEQALTLLEPLIEAAGAVSKARADTHRTAQDMAHFNGQVQARLRVDAERLALLQLHEQSRLAEFTHAAGLTRRWAATVGRQRHKLAQLQFAKAKSDTEEAARDRQAAQVLVSGWVAVGPVERHLNKSAAARDLALLVRQGDLAAEPALQARQRAARALAQGLLALKEHAEKTSRTLHGDIHARRKAEKDSRLAREEALKSADRAETRARELLEQISSVHNDAERAVVDGLASSIDGVPRAAEEALQALEHAPDKISALEREEESLDLQRTEAQKLLSTAIGDEATARGRSEQAQQSLGTAVSRASALEAEARAVALLGSAVCLDADAQVLLERLGAAIAQTERQRVTLQVERARDELARLALKDGHRLPPPQVVSDACRLLAQSEPRIDAWPGWEYIAEFSAEQREEMLVRAPYLVSGVLLNSADDQDRAREILGRAAPTAYYVGVSTVAALLKAEGSAAQGVLFTLPFNAALYDDEAAEAEHKTVEERWVRFEEQLQQLRAAQQHDEKLRQRITQWREDYPVGSLADLQEACAIAGKALSAAEGATGGHRLVMEGFAERWEEIRGELRDTHKEHERWQETSRRLTGLGERLAHIPTWREQITAAHKEHQEHQQQAKDADDSAEEHRRATETLDAALQEQRRAADEAARQWAKLPGAQEMRFEGEPPSDPVPVLREAYERAQANFDQANVPEELRNRLDRAEEEAREAAAGYSVLPQADRAIAHELLRTPEALDERSRAEALELARQALSAAEKKDTRAAVEQGKCDNTLSGRLTELRGLTADGTVPMPTSDTADTIDMCSQSVTEAVKQHATAQEAEAAALGLKTTAAEETSRAKDAAKAFEQLTQTLADTASDADADPYPGDGDAAWTDYLRLSNDAKRAKEELNRSEKDLRGAVEQIRRHAAADRYARLTIPVRQQIIELSVEQTAEHAAGWLAALQTRQRSLSDDISKVNQHRQTIVEHLKGESDKALSLLRSAQKLSRLPRSLEGWAGQEFIHFTFQPQPDDLLLPRLGDLAEEVSAGRTSDGRRVARDGMSLLLRAVHTAVPTGFKVHVLKPDKVVRTERVRVSKVKNVFSGGQQLTAAILLYCTMAALRANQRGRQRSPHSGVLFLDNPIGRANADYLLDLQRQVAQAHGVQLVYTTGLYDEKALGQFPLLVRLRNDAALRTARKYLVVDEVFRPYLDDLPPEDGTGRIDSARIFRRETSDAAFRGDDGTAASGE
ncbi:hypothetical protein QC334_03695 [Streptomyces sp. DH18]|uniref:hypothetical protein n=1 Tax=Streptomyces sp. DH18 TaxID=3040126 RepID=UPI002442DA51|nr:hypothetical protein [Streptomyces sp. DH18]MDG9681851.1 hypothetical protein [Streptomyces sp. DH18]